MVNLTLSLHRIRLKLIINILKHFQCFSIIFRDSLKREVAFIMDVNKVQMKYQSNESMLILVAC